MNAPSPLRYRVRPGYLVRSTRTAKGTRDRSQRNGRGLFVPSLDQQLVQVLEDLLQLVLKFTMRLFVENAGTS